MFQSFGTWDTVSFEDGSSLIGDIINQGQKINRKKMHALELVSLDRA